MNGITYVDESGELSQEMRINLEAKDRSYYDINNDGVLDLSSGKYPIVVDVANIDQYPNEVYALIRKEGLGTSDSSAVLGVNPYTSRAELIAEKSRNRLTQEEKEVGDKTPVKKGRDLEPLIISKFEKYLQCRIIKPIDMYRHKDFPFIKFNFDGVNDFEDRYIPNEIKVVTMYGEKHYDRTKAWFNERDGFGPIPEDPSGKNWSIETKAAYYGIPPYYYTQLQQQILGLDAPYGMLTVLFDKSWEVFSFYVWRDDKVLTAIMTEGFKTWNAIEAKRGPNWSLDIPQRNVEISTI